MRVVICTDWFDWKCTRCSTPPCNGPRSPEGIPVSVQLQAVHDSLSDPSKNNKKNRGSLGVRGQRLNIRKHSRNRNDNVCDSKNMLFWHLLNVPRN